MSADAKVWQGGKNWWYGLHDGECQTPHSETSHRQGDYYLTTVIADIETCLGQKLRWETRTYPDEQVGLVGYVV